MTLRETGEIFFGFCLFFEGKLDFPAEGYQVPHWAEKQCLHYIRTHERVLNQYRPYGKRTVIVFALLNQLMFRMGRNINYEMDSTHTSKFFDVLTNYQLYFKHDIEYLIANLSEPFDLYYMHVQKKIQWYTMPYVIALLKFNKDELLESELVKQEMGYLTKALKVFRFKTELLLQEVAPLQKKFDLMER